MIRKALPILLALIAGFGLSGCGSDGPDGGADMASYLRTPDIEAEKAPTVEQPIALLFPTGPTRRWQMAVNVMDKTSNETVRVDASHAVGSTATDITLSMYQNGKAYRSEVYRVAQDTLSIVAEGGADKMVMSPPMLILRTKAPEGAEYKWEGKITFKGSMAPALAFSRIHALEEIVTPTSKFMAYRVDTSLTTIIAGHPLTFPASRWFVPGIGIVKQTFRLPSGRFQSITVNKELVSYTGG